MIAITEPVTPDKKVSNLGGSVCSIFLKPCAIF